MDSMFFFYGFSCPDLMGFNGLLGTPVSTGTKTMVLKPYGKAHNSYIRDGCNWGKQRHGLWIII
jgi:hypothetical protein